MNPERIDREVMLDNVTFQTDFDDAEFGRTETPMQTANRILERFRETVRTSPDSYRNGDIFKAVRCFEKSINQAGVLIHQLGLTRRKLFLEVRRTLQTL